ncbi:class A beta-lactamase [Anaeromyxobacter paludicola]|uniref:Beta-lactamase n=1 Tax=Anaeromyxobacter paludicola TaxID=2918171 RepID=A0ABM7X912_9BACT|nr:class A beta-lactamase [Anaeromyxobacter paludicola]BDG08288.1 beta-lactamase [Anaeromyxobacter paludicola]
MRGRLGVAAIDTGSGRRLEYRSGERFPMCSTFKVLLAGAVLQRVDRGEERLGRRIAFTPEDVLDHAPVVRAHAGEGALPVEAHCAASIEVSDNSAANLLLNALGGPPALTDFARSLDDRVTRLDRTEPELNTALPGDPRDTTSPAAMVDDLRRLLLAGRLSPGSARRLERWMTASVTGSKRLRAGMPGSWSIADKTGTGARGTSNDVALLRPPGRAPIAVAVYLTGSDAPADDRDAVIAEVGRIIVEVFTSEQR